MSGLDDQDDQPPQFTLEIGVLLGVAAALAAFLMTYMAASLVGPQPGAVGIGAIVAYSAALYLAQPFVKTPSELGLRPAPLRAWVAAALLVPLPLLLSEVENLVHVYVVAREPLPDLPEPTVARMLDTLLSIALVLPVAVELFYRGFLQPRLAPALGSLGAVGAAALLASAAGFMVSGSPRELISTVPSFFVLGLIRRSSGSVLPCFALATAMQLLGLAGSFDWISIQGFNVLDGPPHTPLWILAGPAAMTGVGLALCRGATWPPESRPPIEPHHRLD